MSDGSYVTIEMAASLQIHDKAAIESNVGREAAEVSIRAPLREERQVLR